MKLKSLSVEGHGFFPKWTVAPEPGGYLEPGRERKNIAFGILIYGIRRADHLIICIGWRMRRSGPGASAGQAAG